ncbi:hypothetical protein CXG81DRAFT_20004 [Caulochytrium protostelioides]|uniref:Chitin-binding type-4 domain-containing protein n=1 Tax=Caulochytrium protostelioides TaxID=1555241 RepID=A0A4P9X4H7_9FUNG|nr:hypothetical protein CXG81DRAFT_20004 [Caulochytrium protostelioides]|eukprot:RKO99969.1 hypothetical protein CXG81DRAFT_20004 [Caulochytrium protostelioides]
MRRLMSMTSSFSTWGSRWPLAASLRAGWMLLLVGLLVLQAAPGVKSHGRITFPPPRALIGETDPTATNYPITGGAAHAMVPGVPATRCGGIDKAHSSTPVSHIAPGILDVQYRITANHEGMAVLSLSRDEQTWVPLTEPFAVQGGDHTVRVNIPTSWEGSAILRWFWKARITPELYMNCADILIAMNDTSATNAVALPPTAPEQNAVGSPPHFPPVADPIPTITAKLPHPGFATAEEERQAALLFADAAGLTDEIVMAAAVSPPATAFPSASPVPAKASLASSTITTVSSRSWPSFSPATMMSASNTAANAAAMNTALSSVWLTPMSLPTPLPPNTAFGARAAPAAPFASPAPATPPLAAPQPPLKQNAPSPFPVRSDPLTNPGTLTAPVGEVRINGAMTRVLGPATSTSLLSSLPSASAVVPRFAATAAPAPSTSVSPPPPFAQRATPQSSRSRENPAVPTVTATTTTITTTAASRANGTTTATNVSTTTAPSQPPTADPANRETAGDVLPADAPPAEPASDTPPPVSVAADDLPNGTVLASDPPMPGAGASNMRAPPAVRTAGDPGVSGLTADLVPPPPSPADDSSIRAMGQMTMVNAMAAALARSKGTPTGSALSTLDPSGSAAPNAARNARSIPGMPGMPGAGPWHRRYRRDAVPCGPQ